MLDAVAVEPVSEPLPAFDLILTSSDSLQDPPARRKAGARHAFPRIERDTIALFADVSQRAGFPRSYGQIYGFAFISEEPISFEDVVTRLRMSKGSASQGLHWLRARKLLRRVPAQEMNTSRGVSRRGYFVPVVDFTLLIEVVLRERLIMPLDTGKLRLEGMNRLLGGLARRNRPSQAHLRARLDALQHWHRRLHELSVAVCRTPG